jgi:hypothetical protein
MAAAPGAAPAAQPQPAAVEERMMEIWSDAARVPESGGGEQRDVTASGTARK